MTPKQDHFSELLAAGKHSQAEAYRIAYGPINPQVSSKSIRERASRLARNSNVIAAVEARQADTRDLAAYDRLQFLSELRGLVNDARIAGNYSAAVSGMAAIAKACGFNAASEQVTTNNINVVMQSLSLERLESLVKLSESAAVLEPGITIEHNTP